MLILARVCADFYYKHRNLLGRIVPTDLGKFIDLDESVKQDPLFQMLVDDGSIKFPADAAKDKALEQDPFAGATAEGKEIKPKAKPKAKTETKPKAEAKPTVKTETKTEDKPEEKPTAAS